MNDTPENARVPELLKLDDRSVGFDDLGTNSRLAESSRALRETEQAVELGDELDRRHPRCVVFVEFAIDLDSKSAVPQDVIELGATHLELEVVHDSRLAFTGLLETLDELGDFRRVVAVEVLRVAHLRPGRRDLDLDRNLDLPVERVRLGVRRARESCVPGRCPSCRCP